MAILVSLPPRIDERPTAYADRVGRWYAASAPAAHKKHLGQYMTPLPVARFMARLCHPIDRKSLRILDPGAGAGILSCALLEAIAAWQIKPQEIELIAYETDVNLADHLVDCLTYAERWLQIRGIFLKFTVSTDDFVMARAEALNETPTLFPAYSKTDVFDVVIANPPYFKIPKTDPRARIAKSIVHGQPNIYALFMAVAAALLKLGGELVFITPRSYTAGPYFRQFRERFFTMMRPEAIHLFGSRRDAFSQDEVLQENVVLLARRSGGWSTQSDHETVKISFSTGTRDLARPFQRDVSLTEVLSFASKDKVLHIPVTPDDDEVMRVVRSWQGNLHAYGLEISTGPIVPFRAVSLICKTGNVPETHAPLLWMQNVHTMCIKWPVDARGKGQYIAVNAAARSLLLADRNYVILRRFSAKEQRRRLTAAPLLAGMLHSPVIGLENHLNYIHRPGGSLTTEETYGLAVLLNSALLDTYFRTFNGNTQVSATELRAMPLPPLHTIIEIGRQAISQPNSAEQIDSLVENALNITIPTKPI